MTRIHVVSLPHTLVTRSYDWCAYTAKVRRLIGMLAARDIHAFLYASDIVDEDVAATASAVVPVVTARDRTAWYGQDEWDRNTVFDQWDANHVSWATMNERAAQEIATRWQPGDILGIIGGLCQKPLVDQLAAKLGYWPLTCEWGIGYSGVMEGTHHVYESYAWLHHVTAKRPNDDMHFFDTVIPNTFDSGDFDLGEKPGDYLLYMGRPNPRKGLPIIQEIAARTDLKVLIAGQPGPHIEGTEYIGILTGDEKKKMLAGARAGLVPTTYLEPFGGVAVEFMMSGTPVITTDYGAFTETVQHGQTGFRCRMLRDFMNAVEATEDLDRKAIYTYAHERYSTERGADLYSDYLGNLTSLYGEGWYEGAPVIATSSVVETPAALPVKKGRSNKRKSAK